MSAALTPSVSWAQRPKIVFVTINVSDVVDPDIKVGINYLSRYSLLPSGGEELSLFQRNRLL